MSDGLKKREIFAWTLWVVLGGLFCSYMVKTCVEGRVQEERARYECKEGR